MRCLAIITKNVTLFIFYNQLYSTFPGKRKLSAIDNFDSSKVGMPKVLESIENIDFQTSKISRKKEESSYSDSFNSDAQRMSKYFFFVIL